MKLRSGTIWQIIGTAIAVVAIIVTAGVALWIHFDSEGNTSKGLEATLLSSTSLLNDDVVDGGGELRLTYRGGEVANVWIFQVRVQNTGAQPITSADIEEPIAIDVQGTDEIISAGVVSRSPNDLPVTVSVEGTDVKVSKCLLNPDDEFTVEIKCVKSGDVVPSLQSGSGRIAGVKEIVFNQSLPSDKGREHGSDYVSILVAQAAALMASIVALTIGFRQARKSHRDSTGLG